MRVLKSLTFWVLMVLIASPSFADTAHEIDVKIDAALVRFHHEVKSADRYLAEAKAVLVLPEVLKGGLIVGGEYGEGALLIGERIRDYYNVGSASFGLTAGGEKKDIIILFFSNDALKKFRSRDGWEAGVDGNVAVWKEGSGKTFDATRIDQPILAFVVGVKGLLLDASLQGSKFSKIKK